MPYCTNEDMASFRPNILGLGVTDWQDQIEEAERQIDRVIETRWYRKAAEENGVDWRNVPFDKTKLRDIGTSSEPATQLKQLAVFKALELAYAFLAVESEEPSGFERQRDYFAQAYERELKEILAAGLDYEWDADLEVGGEETKYSMPRRLVRC